MSADPLRARLTALVDEWRDRASLFGLHQYFATTLNGCADQLAVLLRETELASREAAEYPNQAGTAAGEPSGWKPTLDAASLTHILATWKEHSHPPPHLRRGPCPACGILIDLANILREMPEAALLREPPDHRTRHLAEAEAAAGGTVSVGGLVTRLTDDPPPQCRLCGGEEGRHVSGCPRLVAAAPEEQP